MKYLIFTLFIGLMILIFGFRKKNAENLAGNNEVLTSKIVQTEAPETDKTEIADGAGIKVRNQPHEFVEYAKTFIGTPYLYGSIDPARGLDCSGFINAVSNHFGIKVPRSSVRVHKPGNNH